jgi:1,2-diacylglycerol 3-beta-glucosyltransferase
VVGPLLAAAGLPIAAAASYLLLLAIASFRRQPVKAAGVRTRLAVLVPAHDEEALIGRCVASLRAQTYPHSLHRIVVIADNCSDRTAAIAQAVGADVLERRDGRARGKGHALRWAMDLLLAASDPPDAVVVVDADSIAGPDLLSQLAAALEDGADVAQAEYLILADDVSLRSRLLAAAFLLFHRVRFGGRAALGLPASLVGNGMAFSRRLLERLPWNAFTGVEDLEYTINLRLAGFRPRFVGGASVLGPVPHSYRGLRGQRVRWEGGRWHVVRRRLWPLILHMMTRDWHVLDAAIDLAVPPLGLLALGAITGSAVTAAAVALHLAPAWSISLWLLAMAAMTGFVVLGLLSAGAPATIWLALLESPRFLLWKALTYSRIVTGFDPRRWERSERSPPPEPQVGERVVVGGVPIDHLNMAGAMARLRAALTRHQQLHVATVNLDFLVKAQHHPALMSVLQRTELNVADGMPVVWLSRLIGRPVPERVAGADLVPLLVREAASCGAGVFLLGGQDGAAEAAARRLARELPNLIVAGWHEPPTARLEELDDDRLVELINDSGAGVLLVALGNPKQELWIARNRHRIPGVVVAIGVGCVIDLLAQRVQRAPTWMQRAGLEWLHRLISEPKRLVGRFLTDAAWLPLMVTRTFIERAWPGSSPGW